jgi:hypothetical protein
LSLGNSNGQPVVNINSMFKLSSGDVNLTEAIKGGNAHALFYLKYGDGRAISIPFKSGQLVIDEHSPVRQLFNIQNGKTVFNGGSIEVAIEKNGIQNILSTVNGENIAKQFVVNIPSAVPSAINTVDFTPIVKNALPTSIPPLVFANFGAPLKPTKKLDDSTLSTGSTRINVPKAQTPPSESDNSARMSRGPSRVQMFYPEKRKDIDEKEIEQRLKLSGLEAGCELAKISKAEKVNLETMSREEYVKYACANYLAIEAQEIRNAS